LNQIPVFYWLIYCDREPTIELLREIFDGAKFALRELILRVSYFIDTELFQNLKSRVDSKNLGPEFEEYKKHKGENFMIPHIHLKSDVRFREVIPIFQEDNNKLCQIATELAEELRDGKRRDNYKLWQFDFKLYKDRIFTKSVQ
jgi:hypothetical protein